MARRLPNSPRIKRRRATQPPQKKILIICEGRNTEPEYIKDFARDRKHPLVECESIPGVGVPKSIVDRAILGKRELEKQARKSGNSFDKNYEVWCVSDMDDHPGVSQEIQRAKDNGLYFALSNPCVELWGYLHYRQNDAPRSRHEMQKLLAQEMPGYDHDKGAKFNYDDMKERYVEAVKRAKELRTRREEEDIPKGNPSTDMFELMESIGTVGKILGS